jgi:hypothetical protein
MKTYGLKISELGIFSVRLNNNSSTEKIPNENKRIMRIWQETQIYAYLGEYSAQTNQILDPKFTY